MLRLDYAAEFQQAVADLGEANRDLSRAHAVEKTLREQILVLETRVAAVAHQRDEALAARNDLHNKVAKSIANHKPRQAVRQIKKHLGEA